MYGADKFLLLFFCYDSRCMDKTKKLTYPQSELKLITDNCCLFMCYLWCMGIIPEKSSSWLRYVADALDANLIDEECTVLDASKLIEHFTGKKRTVTKKNITSALEINAATPVLFRAEGFIPHWVVVEHGEIAFNPLLNSKSVSRGKPCEARIITK